MGLSSLFSLIIPALTESMCFSFFNIHWFDLVCCLFNKSDALHVYALLHIILYFFIVMMLFFLLIYSDSVLRHASSDFKKMGQRIFVFIVGGATRSEVQIFYPFYMVMVVAFLAYSYS